MITWIYRLKKNRNPPIYKYRILIYDPNKNNWKLWKFYTKLNHAKNTLTHFKLRFEYLRSPSYNLIDYMMKLEDVTNNAVIWQGQISSWIKKNPS